MFNVLCIYNYKSSAILDSVRIYLRKYIKFFDSIIISNFSYLFRFFDLIM
jgi:hypothetical protein